MRGQVFGWRWRANPLRRRSDVVEAWTVLCVVLLLALGAPAAGVLVGRWAHADARAQATAERAALDRVSAVIVEKAPASVPSAHDDKQPTYWVRARGTELKNVRILGTTEGYPDVGKYEHAEGRQLDESDFERRRPVAVIGTEVAEKRFRLPSALSSGRR